MVCSYALASLLCGGRNIWAYAFFPQMVGIPKKEARMQIYNMLVLLKKEEYQSLQHIYVLLFFSCVRFCLGPKPGGRWTC